MKRIVFLSIFAILLAGFLFISEQKAGIVGKASYDKLDKPIQLQGKIFPSMTDNTIISFKAGDVELASSNIRNNKYGYTPELFFRMDDPATVEKEGYALGDRVQVYIEDVEIGEISYFGEIEKDFQVSISQRVEISRMAAERRAAAKAEE